MVQSSHRADFVRNNRVYNRNTTNTNAMVIGPMTIPMITPVLFWFPSGGGYNWLLISVVHAFVESLNETLQAKNWRIWRNNEAGYMFSLKVSGRNRRETCAVFYRVSC